MIVHLVIKNCDMMIKNKKQGGLVMGLDDVKSNFHAIKSSRVIAFKKKVDLLVTQLKTLDALYLSDTSEVTLEESQKARLLYDQIENYLNIDDYVLCS